MASRKGAALCIQAILLLTMVAWQCHRFFQMDLVKPSDLYTQSATSPQDVAQWPYLVASTIFLMEFMICFVLILLLRLMLHFKDPGSGEVLFLTRLREVAEMLAFISFFSGVYYTYKGCHTADQPRHMGGGSFYAGEMERRQGSRMLLWTALAPQQWVLHARLYTKGSIFDAFHLYLSTALCMIFGLAGNQVDMANPSPWVRPHWEVCLWFTLACLALLTTLKKASELPMEPVTAKSGFFYLKVKYVVWSLYPTVYLLRTFGFITAWQEEVLAFTCLDVVAKSLSLIASCTGPLFTLFVSTWGHWHVSGGSHDIRVTVREPTWSVQSVELDSSPQEGEQITGLTAGQSDFLQEAVENQEDRRRLLQIAKQVDQQMSFMAQKTPLTVRLAGGVRAQAECFVSRSLWGHRQLAISLLEFQGGFDTQKDHRKTFDNSSYDDTRSPLESPRSQGSVGESQPTSSENVPGGRFTMSSLQLQRGAVEAPQRLTSAKVALHQHWSGAGARARPRSTGGGQVHPAHVQHWQEPRGIVANMDHIAEPGRV